MVGSTGARDSPFDRASLRLQCLQDSIDTVVGSGPVLAGGLEADADRLVPFSAVMGGSGLAESPLAILTPGSISCSNAKNKVQKASLVHASRAPI
jgi:hypothetical protein